jgi:hypothetical protein
MSAPLPGEHYCAAHQGNHSHYDSHNCKVCQLLTRIIELNDRIAQLGVENDLLRKKLLTPRTMTPEAKRIAIAKACGWTAIQESDYKPFGEAQLVGYSPKGGENLQNVPDYLNDLNAMHEAENYALTKLGLDVIPQLRKVAGERNGYCATAEQRAEALLHTLGEQEDGS